MDIEVPISPGELIDKMTILEIKLIKIKDIAVVDLRIQRAGGLAFSDNRQAVVLAIIKEASARMENLEKKMNEMVGQFRADYPQMEFSISQDQTRLLDYSLMNLKESLITGGLLAFFVMFFFLRDARSPLIIGISMPTTLVISLLFFGFGTQHLLTRQYTERAERAFAAEFLAPAAGIADLVAGDFSDQALDRAAAHFQVNRTLVEHQVENQIAA